MPYIDFYPIVTENAHTIKIGEAIHEVKCSCTRFKEQQGRNAEAETH